MRKIPPMIFAFILFILSFSLSPLTFVKAENRYGRVIKTDIPLYKDESLEEILFYLPISYYVLIKKETTSYFKVEIFSDGDFAAAIDGFVKSEDLYFGDEYVFSPYYELSVKTDRTTPFYSDIELKNKVRFIFENRSLKIYGKASKESDESVIYLAEYDGNLGYVEEKNLQPFSFTFHPTPLPKLNTDDDVPVQNFEGNTENQTINALKLSVIAVLTVAVIIVLIYSFQPKKNKRDDNYVDL